MKTRLADVNGALQAFVTEMKAQGVWDNITVVSASDFGRTLTQNGLGTDHAWGGNYFLAGGKVKGGQILGAYPSSFAESGSFNIGRGRMLPTTSWEAVWNGIATWFGVAEADMPVVLPNRQNFADNQLLTSAQMFE